MASRIFRGPNTLVAATFESAIAAYVGSVGDPGHTQREGCLQESSTMQLKVHMDLGFLFWSLQGKHQQLAFYDKTDYADLERQQPSNGSTDLFLCARCGRWVTAQAFLAHLPHRRLVAAIFNRARAQFPSISTARCNSLACSMGSRKDFCEGYRMRVSLLRTDDWPVVCRLCQCIVMRSFLNLH